MRLVTLLLVLLSGALRPATRISLSDNTPTSGGVKSNGVWVLTGFETGSLNPFFNRMGTDAISDDSHDCDPINDSRTAATGNYYVECEMMDGVCPHDCGGHSQYTNHLYFKFCEASSPYNSGSIPCSPATVGELWVGWSQRFDATLRTNLIKTKTPAPGSNFKWFANRHSSGLEGWTVGVAGNTFEAENPQMVRIADDGGHAVPLWTGLDMGPNEWRDWLYKLTYENGNQTCSSTWSKLHSSSRWILYEDHRCFTRTGEDHTVQQAISIGIFYTGPGGYGKDLIDNVVIANCDPRSCAPSWGNNQ